MSQEPSQHQPVNATPQYSLTEIDLSSASISALRPLTKEFPSPVLNAQAGQPRPLSAIIEKIEKTIASHYAPQEIAKYHWVGHAYEVLEAFEILAARAIQAGTQVNVEAGRVAAYFHDAEFNVDSELVGFKSKEHFSANYAYNWLVKEGAPEEFAREVYCAILATDHSYEPKTSLEKLLRAADLYKLAAPYEVFVQNTRNFHQETINTSGRDISFEDFARASLRHLPLYVWRDLQITGQALNSRGASEWHEMVLSNVIKLFSEISGGREQIKIVAKELSKVDLLTARTSPALNCDTMLILVSPDPQALELELSKLRSAFVEPKLAPIIFAVPGSIAASPIPNCSVDELWLVEQQSISARELGRLLNAGGKIISTT